MKSKRILLIVIPQLMVAKAYWQFHESALAVLGSTPGARQLSLMADAFLAIGLGLVTLVAYCLIMVLLLSTSARFEAQSETHFIADRSHSNDRSEKRAFGESRYRREPILPVGDATPRHVNERD